MAFRFDAVLDFAPWPYGGNASLFRTLNGVDNFIASKILLPGESQFVFYDYQGQMEFGVSDYHISLARVDRNYYIWGSHYVFPWAPD